MFQEIYVVSDDPKSVMVYRKLFAQDTKYHFESVKTDEIEIALRNIPSLFIINEDNINGEVIDICKKIRADEDNIITPIIVISSNGDKQHRMEVLKTSIQYYIKKPVDPEYIYYTIKNIVSLMYMNRRVSPLTGLPGNVQIHAEMKKRLVNKEEFAVLYFDLDNFKAYNDVYGFIQGDEIIKFTARTISNHIHQIENAEAFIGHIGGDDFVAIVSKVDYEKVCQDIIIEFDSKVLNYFTEADQERGYLEVANRKGIMEQFPLTSISIGVVEADKGRFHNILEIGEVGAQVKHSAKTTMGSSYAIDRRKKG